MGHTLFQCIFLLTSLLFLTNSLGAVELAPAECGSGNGYYRVSPEDENLNDFAIILKYALPTRNETDLEENLEDEGQNFLRCCQYKCNATFSVYYTTNVSNKTEMRDSCTWSQSCRSKFTAKVYKNYRTATDGRGSIVKDACGAKSYVDSPRGRGRECMRIKACFQTSSEVSGLKGCLGTVTSSSFTGTEFDFQDETRALQILSLTVRIQPREGGTFVVVTEYKAESNGSVARYNY